MTAVRTMLNKRNYERFGWLALALTFAVGAAADEPAAWLERMNQALTTRNYDVVFTHWQGGRVETLRIIHRVQDGEVTERLVSLDGSGREFIRTGTELACYLPDRREVVVERRPDQSLLLGSLPKFDASTADSYEIVAVKRTRQMGREAQLIAVKPKDEFRYGYRLWIDEATAMPLKTQLCDGRGRVIEQVVFGSLSLPETIPDSAFKPDMSTEGFKWLRNEVSGGESVTSPVTWDADKLPPGFRMSVRSSQVIPGSNEPVAHLVFTDGVASVSVFVESQRRGGGGGTGPVPSSGSARFGSSSVFSTFSDGHKVTVVGEVPPATVREIANSVRAQPASAPPALSIQGPPRR